MGCEKSLILGKVELRCLFCTCFPFLNHAFSITRLNTNIELNVKVSGVDGPKKLYDMSFSIKPPFRKVPSSTSVLARRLERKEASAEAKPGPEVRESLDCASIAKKIFREKLGIVPRQTIQEEKVGGTLPPSLPPSHSISIMS